MVSFAEKISVELSLKLRQVSNTLQLLNESATVPFIARYRKERTGGLTDIQILDIQKLNNKFGQLEDRKKTILKSIEEQGSLTDQLQNQIEHADTLSHLEDIYLPYKPKRKTRASVARSRGLEPLAKMIMSENVSSVDALAERFVSAKNEINTVEEALQGAQDIMAEWINERVSVRNSLRRLFEVESVIYSEVVKGKEEEGEKYQNYFDWNENAAKSPSHRILAMLRGEKEGILKLKVTPEYSYALQMVKRHVIKGRGEASEHKKLAVGDALKRLLFPSLESEFKAALKQKADDSGIHVFSENLKQLLLAPPLGQKNVLAIDPGFKSGCKIVCLDRTGKLMNNDTIFPHPPQRETAMAVKKLKSLANAYKIDAIAIGNGTAGRETEGLIKRINFDRELIAIMVSESGASVYSASDIARQEFPDYDVTVRGAVSIGRRLMDPLAELVKIDPKAIGVGQYQHDINQKQLQESLQTTVELCVNKVGVELNTASKELLTHVSGIGPKLAERIIAYRDQTGVFKSREELKNVKGLGKKAFEQSGGFLRIKNGENPLDESAVHPENYGLVEKISVKTGLGIDELIGNEKLSSLVNAKDYITENVGLPTIKDIINELEKPGRDPRKAFSVFTFDRNIKSINDIKVGMKLPAVVTNITDFGAFVDIGVKESGLIHRSQIADKFVKNPSDFLKLNQQLIVKVVEVNIERKRIGLSLIGMNK